jgi:large subunit ribosomal protein L15
MIELSNLKPSTQRVKYKRVGRGNSSGKGTTAGRGTKGQRARTGGRNKLTRRGLKSLIQPTPKLRGFVSHRPKRQIVTVAQLQTSFPDGATVRPSDLVEAGLIATIWPGVKVLGAGAITKKFTVLAEKFSASAEAAILKSGGKIVRLTQPTRTLPKRTRSTT